MDSHSLPETPSSLHDDQDTSKKARRQSALVLTISVACLAIAIGVIGALVYTTWNNSEDTAAPAATSGAPSATQQVEEDRTEPDRVTDQEFPEDTGAVLGGFDGPPGAVGGGPVGGAVGAVSGGPVGGAVGAVVTDCLEVKPGMSEQERAAVSAQYFGVKVCTDEEAAAQNQAIENLQQRNAEQFEQYSPSQPTP